MDSDIGAYESADEDRHIDLGLRYASSIDPLDLGVYNFPGTCREPTLHPESDDHGRLLLVPHYEQVSQTGIDLQLALAGWVLKLEVLHRTGQVDDFIAAVTGFEYHADIGIIVTASLQFTSPPP